MLKDFKSSFIRNTFFFIPVYGPELPHLCNFLSDDSYKSVFCYVSEGTLGHPLGMDGGWFPG